MLVSVETTQEEIPSFKSH